MSKERCTVYSDCVLCGVWSEECEVVGSVKILIEQFDCCNRLYNSLFCCDNFAVAVRVLSLYVWVCL